jgi:hypothetical protein
LRNGFHSSFSFIASAILKEAILFCPFSLQPPQPQPLSTYEQDLERYGAVLIMVQQCQIG